ncbi:peptidylprolyl isomerase/peptidyl-prolyl cis-trans isomerase D [Salinimicrobium sediminis]|uniref:Peptidylprolyl isomerase/peptidyl-prolyl cis-trans isomerase D n=1 Tax=Salinimicrobium sediminis TaxID=1343891 RepID=A0A285X4P5_9FLAO|nr:peptidylprolyl isomerase [Salinimicrobium sediminis]SOC79976.1 peptidylprolyl isomerase/peptidyl-prolyl cis-trans isomerase D [Salinimicrobium sediminis]
MAVLNKIRQRSVFLIVIIALALFSFVLADVIRNGGMVSQKSQNTIATINGEDIEREQFARQVEAYQRNLGPNATTSQAVNMVWDLNVRRALMEEQLEELGIRVEEAQVKEMLRQEMGNNPNFVNEAGMFDENRLREYVATLKSTSPQAYQQWLDYENNIAESAREQIYLNLVRAGVGATLLEGEQSYRFANDNVDMEFVQIPYSSVDDSEVEISKSDIRKYIEANPEKFSSEATRDIRYVFFEETASPEDEQEVRKDLEGLLNSRVEFNAVTKSNDTVAGFSNTSEYETFVNENSDQKFLNSFVFKDQLPAEHADSLFNLGEGEIYGPFQFNGSWRVSRLIETAQIPDSSKAAHILVAWQGSPVGGQVTRTKEEAKALADSISNVVKNDRAKFAELASEFSADASNKEDGGDLGWFSPGMMVPAFNDFVFTNNEGTIGVVETQFGYHVINIQEQTDREKAIKLATISRAIEPSEKSMNALFAEVTNFELDAKEGDFEELAKANEKEVRPVKDIQQLEESIPGLGSQRRIVQWAFEDGVEVGDIKRFEVSGGYVVAQVTAVNEKGLKSVESASSTVIPILQKQKKAEIIKSKISGNDLQQIAQNQGVEVNSASSVNRNNPTLPGVGNEPKVVGTAFALEQGAVSKPIAGEKGVFVVKVLQKTEAPKLDSYRPYASREAAARRTTVNTEVFEALKENAEIEDNRARFY